MHGSRRWKELQGEAKFSVPREIASIVVPRLGNAEIEVAVGDNKLVIRPPKTPAMGNLLEMVLVRGDNVSDAEWTSTERATVASGPPEITGPDGKRFSTDSYGGSGGSDRVSMHYDVRFPSGSNATLENARISRELPISMQSVTAKFAFHDLPLP